MAIIDKQLITARLQDLIEPQNIQGFQVDDDAHVMFSLIVDPSRGTALEDLRLEAEKRVLEIAGVEKATIVLTASKPAEVKQAAPDPHGMAKNPKLNIAAKHIIAVASGKGGVGKSTVAMNLAKALSMQNLKVGILDCDIYGPSLPTMSGLPIMKPEQTDKGQIVPFLKDTMSMMSIGFMLAENAPLVWRGPMVQTAIYQMLRDVDWTANHDGEMLDILVLDMPPGTGDAQLTIAQKIDVDGAIIVSTPQDIALIDAIKAIAMFEKTDVKILGLIENMSTHFCENCGHENHIFGHDGAKNEAAKQKVDFLGAVLLDIKIRKNGDDGILEPPAIFEDIASNILSTLKH